MLEQGFDCAAAGLRFDPSLEGYAGRYGEVVFWLATDDGPCQIRLRPQESVAFVPAAQRELVEGILRRETPATPVELRPLALCDFHHRPALGMYSRQYRQLTRLGKQLKQIGVDFYEADIFPPDRYMMARFITAPVQFGGQPNGNGPLLDSDMKPAPDYRPKLRLVSLDIETSAQGELYSIALEGCGQRQVYMLGPANGDNTVPLDFDLEYCESRAVLLERLNAWMTASNETVFFVRLPRRPAAA